MAEQVGGIYYEVDLDTRKLVDGQRNVTREVDKAAASFNAITAAVKLYAAAMALVKSAQMADETRLLAARVQVAAGSIENAAAAMAALQRISVKTQTDMAASVSVFTRLNASIVQMGGNQGDTLRITELLGMAIKVSGASAAEASSAMTQFGQALGSGKLAGDELRSLLENAPYLMRQLADGLGVPIGALKQLGEEGKLTADVVTNALSKAAATIEADFRKMPQTLAGAFAVATDAAARANEAFDTLTGSSAALTGATKGVGDVLDMLAQQFANATSEGGKLGRNDLVKSWAENTALVLTYVVDAADFVVRGFRQMGTAIGGLAAAAGAAARGELAQAANIVAGMKADVLAIGNARFAGDKMRSQMAALAMVPGADRLDRAAAAGTTSKLTAPAGAGASGTGKGKGSKRQEIDAIGEAEAEFQKRLDDWWLANEEALDKAEERAADKAADAAKKMGEDRARGQAFALGLMAEGDPLAELQLQLQRRTEMLDAAATLDQENAGLYAAARVALEQQTADQMAAIRQREVDQQAANNQMSLALAGDLAGSLFQLLQRSGKERTALGKALFLTSKALAVAEIILNTEVAAAKAGAQLGIFGLPMAAMIRATGYASAGMVGGLALGEAFGGGRQYGGPVSAGRLYRVNETGKSEMFTAANGAQYMMPTANGRVTAANQIGGGGAQPWTINVYGAAPGTTASVDPDRRTIDIAVAQAEARVAEGIASNSGPVFRALRSATNVQPKQG